MKHLIKYITLLLCIFFVLIAKGQDIEALVKNKKPLSLSGGVSAEQTAYTSNGINPRRDPYNYFLSGNLSLGFYNWTAPISFRFSNQKLDYNYPTYQQPFNQFGMSPKYKWLTLHGGYRNMTFSPFTLSGHQFLGGGVEIAPGNVIKVSAMYGRMFKAVQYDSLALNNYPSYERYGYGLKTELNIKKTQVSLIGFRASDNQNSIVAIPDSLGLRPQENLVLSAGINQKIGPISINAEYAVSALTQDKNAEKELSKGLYGNLGELFTSNSTTSYFNAMKFGMSYPIKKVTVGMNYERVDPEYRTLGAYFFNNDLEKYALSLAFPTLKDKMRWSSNVGIQRNNLNNQKVSSMFRFAGSLSLNWKVNEKLDLNASFSNFYTTNNILNQFTQINAITPYDKLDTLNYQQVSNSLNIGGTYQLSKTDKKTQNINFNSSAQRAIDQQNGIKTDNGSTFVNGNASYSLGFIPSSFSLALGANYYQQLSKVFNSNTYGPTLQLSKGILKNKAKTSFSSAWNASFKDGQITNRILNLTFGASTLIKKKHNLNMSLIYLNRMMVSNNSLPFFNEFTARLTYSYRFSVKRNTAPSEK